MNFKGRTALVAGAAVGIGRAAVLKFAEQGANLILADVNFTKLETVKKELEKYTNDVLIFECDVSDENRVSEIIRKSYEHFGKIDILVNNAAIWQQFVPFNELSTEDWRKYIDVNVMSVVYFTRGVIDKMAENKYGRIVNVAGVFGNGNMVHYSATKGAVISFTKALAKEVAGKGILVNSISPGSVSPSQYSDVNYTEPSGLSYMERTGSDMENANLICFLASDEASYISGQNIVIDGIRKKL